MLKYIRNKWKCMSIIMCLFCYVSGYIVVRSEKLLIHHVSYRTSQTNKRSYYHAIYPGDFGIPPLFLLNGHRWNIWTIAGMCSYAYTPLRISESLFWYLYPRQYEIKKMHRQ